MFSLDHAKVNVRKQTTIINILFKMQLISKKYLMLETHCNKMFKKMKQNFQLYYFYGENKNARRTQVWCTLIAQKYTSWLPKGEGVASCLITAKHIPCKIKGRSILKITN